LAIYIRNLKIFLAIYIRNLKIFLAIYIRNLKIFGSFPLSRDFVTGCSRFAR